MNGTPPLTEQQRAAEPASQWTAGLGASLRKAEVLHQSTKSDLTWEARRTPSCVWLILTLSSDIKLGIRSAFCPTGLLAVKVSKARSTAVEFHAEGGIGSYDVKAEFLEGTPSMLRVTTTLTPAESVTITAAPRDLCVLDSRFDPYRGKGRLYTCQTGNTAGQAYFSALEGKAATVFYFQNLSALSNYFQQTAAKPGGTVAGEWPEAGFRLPLGSNPMRAGKPIVILDSFIAGMEDLPIKESDAALSFINGLARIYPLLPRPKTEMHDWPETARKTMRSLTGSPHCSRKIARKTFLEAYVGSSYKPPESMVQAALLVPLMEYRMWLGKPVTLVEKLQHVPKSFFDEELQLPVRWLPGAEFTKDETSEEEVRYRMDSWYLLHTLMNFGRMAEMGQADARECFLASIEPLIKVARHFKYDWPVFYDQRSLKVFKAETKPGEGGEQDAPGLYLHIMLQAYLLTHDRKYVEEAEAAALKLDGLSFGVLYQTNNTVLGSIALARLWKATGKTLYKDLSLVSLAGTLSHLWLWYLGKDTLTYMALPPLHDAPYVALYEEAEILATLQTYQEEMGDQLPEGLALLLAEYQKQLLARGKYYFPSELPADLPVKEPKEGIFNPRLHIPLEGLGGPGDPAGTVGQAVYAAAAPFTITSRCWHRAAGVPFQMFCDYPVFRYESSGNRRKGEVRFRVGGVPLLSCSLKILLPRLSARRLHFTLQVGDEKEKLLRYPRDETVGAEILGGSEVCLAWTTT